MSSPRAYQEKLLADIRQAAKHHKRILVQAPTGSGKSYVFAQIIADAKAKDTHTLFLVHRRELIYQAQQHLSAVGVRCGILMAGELETGGQDAQLGSVPTVYRRLKKMDVSRYGLVIIDESHHVGAMSYNAILAQTQGAHVIGFTATPVRKDGKPLGESFTSLVCGPTVKSLIAGGYLADTEYMAPTLVDMRGVSTSAGDFSAKDVEEKVMPKIIGGVVEHYLSYAGRKGIVFSCNIKHSNYLADEFSRRGKQALVVDSDCSEDERETREAEFRSASDAVLINVGIYTEGYDVPECDTIVLARPTKSLGLFLQMCGRGMRPKQNGKPLLIIDHGANVYRHGLVEQDREWSLTTEESKASIVDRTKAMVREYATCPKCGAMVVGRQCPCGQEITAYRRAENVRELKRCSLQLLDKSTMTTRPRKKNAPTKERWLWYLQQAADKAYKAGWAAHRYRSFYGHWPSQNKSLEGYVPKHKDGWAMDARLLLRNYVQSHDRAPVKTRETSQVDVPWNE